MGHHEISALSEPGTSSGGLTGRLPQHDLGIRTFCLVNGAFWAALAFPLYFQASWVTSLWPWPEAGMSFVFLASIMAAIAAPSIWIGLTGELAVFAGVGINTMFVNLCLGAYLLWRRFHWNDNVAGAVTFSVVGFALGAAFFLWSRRLPVRDPRPMPPLVRRAFVAFTLILIGAGGALALQLQHVFPWDLQPASSTIFGFIFLGAATYFMHAIAHPRWAFGVVPLWAFLAYDVVLLGPYSRMLVGPAPDVLALAGGSVNRPSLVIYLTIISGSALLALYMVLVHPSTRMIRPRQPGG